MALGLKMEGQPSEVDPYSLWGGVNLGSPAQPEMGSQMDQGLPGMMVPPPKTPEEVAARRNGWTALIDRVKNDPQIQMAMIKFGTGLMQPVPAGQSSAGHLGGALQSSVDYLQALKDQESRRKLVDSQARNVEAQTSTEREKPGQVRAQTAGTRATTRRTEALIPGEVGELDAKIDLARSRGVLDDATAEYYRARAKGYPDEVKAELARAEASKLSATRNPALETLRVQAQAMVDAGDAENISQAMSILGQGRATGRQSAQVQNRADIERRLKTSNPQNEDETPEAYKARINKLVLDEEKKAKVRPFRESYTKWLETNRINYGTESEAYNDYVGMLRRFGELPEGVEEAPIFTRDQVKQHARKTGKTEEEVIREIRAKGGDVRGR